jgi:heptosyltransferase-1
MTSRPEKLWPEKDWIELGRSLGMAIALPWGSDEERARAERIAAGIGNASVTGRMDLRELAAFFAESIQVVGVDTGLTHLAAALGCTTVGIYCGTDPALYGLRAPHALSVGGDGQVPSPEQVRKALT